MALVNLSALRKRRERMRYNAEHLIEKFGAERVVMGSFTTRANLSFDEFQEVWNSYVTNILRPQLGIVGDDWNQRLCGMSVIEPQKRGAPHAHLLVAVNSDVGTGLQWLRKGRGWVTNPSTRNDALKALQALLIATWDAYVRSKTGETDPKISNAHCLPIRKSAASAAYYLSDYLKKGQDVRPGEWKGRRLYRQYGGDHPCNSNFTLYARKEGTNYVVYDLGIVRRARIAEFARNRGCDSLDALCRVCGTDVLYRYSKEINETLLPRGYVFPSRRTAEWEADSRIAADPDVKREHAEARLRRAHRHVEKVVNSAQPWGGDNRIALDDVYSKSQVEQGRKAERHGRQAELRKFRLEQINNKGDSL